jgi:hypothetical protein
MIIIYQDEYGVELNKIGLGPCGIGQHPPMIGDMVVLDGDDWRVVSRTFYPQNNTIVINVTQNLVREKKEESDTRLSEMQGAIVKIKSKQESTEKKQRILTEQLVSLRTYLKTQKGS